ncbi:hypothetical protein D3C77_402960 [compost metagenome]
MYSKQLLDLLDIKKDTLVHIEFKSGNANNYYIVHIYEDQLSVISEENRDGHTYGPKHQYKDLYSFDYIERIDQVTKRTEVLRNSLKLPKLLSDDEAIIFAEDACLRHFFIHALPASDVTAQPEQHILWGSSKKLGDISALRQATLQSHYRILFETEPDLEQVKIALKELKLPGESAQFQDMSEFIAAYCQRFGDITALTHIEAKALLGDHPSEFTFYKAELRSPLSPQKTNSKIDIEKRTTTQTYTEDEKNSEFKLPPNLHEQPVLPQPIQHQQSEPLPAPIAGWISLADVGPSSDFKVHRHPHHNTPLDELIRKLADTDRYWRLHHHFYFFLAVRNASISDQSALEQQLSEITDSPDIFEKLTTSVLKSAE